MNYYIVNLKNDWCEIYSVKPKVKFSIFTVLDRKKELKNLLKSMVNFSLKKKSKEIVTNEYKIQLEKLKNKNDMDIYKKEIEFCIPTKKLKIDKYQTHVVVQKGTCIKMPTCVVPSLLENDSVQLYVYNFNTQSWELSFSEED